MKLNLRIGLTAAVVLTFACVVQAAPARRTQAAAGVLDQEYWGTPLNYAAVTGDHYSYAQTFTAGRTGSMDRVQLDIRIIFGTPGDLQIEIRTTAGGAPSATVLASVVMDRDTVAACLSDSGVDVSLSPPVPVTAGTRYAIVLSSPGTPTLGPYYSWNAQQPGTYPGGDGYTNAGDGWVIDFLGFDFGFRTYVVPPDTTPPAITLSFPTPNANGWYSTASVAGSVTASDAGTGGSDIAAITCTGATMGAITPATGVTRSAPLSVAAEGVTTVSCTATDSAGNAASISSTVRLDRVAPNIALMSASAGGQPYVPGTTTYWPVTLTFSCADGESGSGAVSPAVTVTVSTPGTNQQATGACEDQAGNTGSATVTGITIVCSRGWCSPTSTPAPTAAPCSRSCALTATPTPGPIVSATATPSPCARRGCAGTAPATPTVSVPTCARGCGTATPTPTASPVGTACARGRC